MNEKNRQTALPFENKFIGDEDEAQAILHMLGGAAKKPEATKPGQRLSEWREGEHPRDEGGK